MFKDLNFDSNLLVEKIGSKLWKTYRNLQYTSKDGHVIEVPKGFITDFASVPRIFWIFFPPDGIYTAAAVVHDYLYNVKVLDRKTSDGIFLEAMKVLEAKFYTRYPMYLAVRLFGWIPWKKKG